MMALFAGEGKLYKQNLVELQNKVLSINEKKLQVSEEFLDKMTKIYVSKRMKKINALVSDLYRVGDISLLFKKYDLIVEGIKELIDIEKIYMFNKPIPSEYLELIEDNLDDFINSSISREWQRLQLNYSAQNEPDDLNKKVTAFFKNYDMFTERMSMSSISLLTRLRENANITIISASSNSDSSNSDDVNSFTEETFDTIELSEPQTAAAQTNEN